MENSHAGLEASLAESTKVALQLVDCDANEESQRVVDHAFRLLNGVGPWNSKAHARLLTVAAILSHRRGDSAETARLGTASLAIANVLKEPNLRAHAYLALARASLSVGDQDNTFAALEEAWPEARDGSDLELRVWCQTLFGIVHLELGHHAEAIDWYEQAQASALEAGSSRLQAVCAANLTGPWLKIADRAVADGQPGLAREAWQSAVHAADAALQMVERSGIPRWKQVAVINRSAALVGLEHDEEAVLGLAQGLQLATESKTASDVLEVTIHKARMLRRHGNLVEACTELDRGIDVGEAAQARPALIDIYELASDIAEQRGDLKSALAHCRRRQVLYVEMAADRAAMRSKVLAVRLATERAQAEALASRDRAIALDEENRVLVHRAEMLGREALQDPLTGLANRRRLGAFLEEAQKSTHAIDSILCVAMIDIDHFKSVNDRHSHAVGDRVLQQFGALLRHACRDIDLPARYGGEEFCLVLRQVRLVQAVAVAERLRVSIQEFDWSVFAPELAVTASIGICETSSSQDLAESLANADSLLYRAKREGRNRVVWK